MITKRETYDLPICQGPDQHSCRHFLPERTRVIHFNFGTDGKVISYSIIYEAPEHTSLYVEDEEPKSPRTTN